MEHFAAACEAVVDAQGEVDVCKVAPIVGNGYIINIRVRKVIADKVIGAVVPAHIYAVVIFRFLLFLTCGECRVGDCFEKGVVAVVLARCVGVLVVAGEREEQHTSILLDILNKLTPYKLFKLPPIDNLCFLVGICRS